MTASLRDRGVNAILLDIEGTTTPIAFVHQVLFPFARAHLVEYLSAETASAHVRDVVAQLAVEHRDDGARGEEPPAWSGAGADGLVADVAAYALWLMDRDRKSAGLKLLQGHIWELGYRSGLLKGEVFPDTAPAIRRWRAAGLSVAIYSSGSVLAQRLLFQSTSDGDLTSLIDRLFDTAVGPKTAADSYVRIVHAWGKRPGEVLFISDVTAELSAARAAGLQTLLSIRPDNPPQSDAGAFEAIRSFDVVRA